MKRWLIMTLGDHGASAYLWRWMLAVAIPLVLLFPKLSFGLSPRFTPSLLGAADVPGWTLIWSDEFEGPNGSRVDSQKWTLETGGSGWGNNELEYYTNRLQNAYLENGALVIKANRET